MRTRETAELRVAIFTDTYAPQVNGVARTLRRLASAIEERGHAVRVFTTDDERATPEPLVQRARSMSFWAYPELQLAAPRPLKTMRELRAWKTTLVHVATPFGVGLSGVGAARCGRIPVVSSYHTSLSEYARFYGLSSIAEVGWSYLRRFHNWSRRTYVPTAAVRDDLRARGFSRVHLWSRGVDDRVFSPTWRSDELRASWSAGPNTIVLTYVGRVAKEKSVDVAVDAAAQLRRRGRDVRFVVVGDGPADREIRHRAPEGTVFTGRLEGAALSAAYASSDIQLFPSTTDTFGNVMLEGMASGLAIAAANVAPTREVCGASNAELFIPGDAADLTNRLDQLVGAPARLAQLRERSVTHARTRSWKTVFDDLVADYVRVVAAAARTTKNNAASRAVSRPAVASAGAID